MIFAPHKLFVKLKLGGGFDDEGRPIPIVEKWEEVGECRCDDNSTQKLVSVNGENYTYSYKIVYEGKKIEAGTEVKVMSGDDIRAKGIVVQSSICNYFNYAQIWL